MSLRSEQALRKVDEATKALLASGARPGSAEYDRLKDNRQAAAAQREQAVGRQRRVNLTNPTAQDVSDETRRLRQGGRLSKPKSTPRGAAARFASGASKAGKFAARDSR